MEWEQPEHGSHLFTLRLWYEPLGEGRGEWRGKVRHVASGEARFFRDYSALLAFLQEMLPQIEGETDSLEPGRDDRCQGSV
jgi:hypothetical protein